MRGDFRDASGNWLRRSRLYGTVLKGTSALYSRAALYSWSTFRLRLLLTAKVLVSAHNASRAWGMTYEGSLIIVRRRVVLVTVTGAVGDERSRFTGDPLRP